MTDQAIQAGLENSTLKSLAIFMDEGGIFMWVILGIWSLGAGIALVRAIKLLRNSVKGRDLLGEIKKHVMENNVAQAIALCSQSKSYLPMVMGSGLKRANQSKEQISDAVEATVLEVAPKVDRGLPTLALFANISTLTGLLGTIYGLIQSFSAVAGADPAEKAKLLALGISKAMNTTALGLISAICLMLIHSALSGKAEKILAEIDEYAMKLIDLLGTRRIEPSSPTASPPPPPSSHKEAA